MNAAGHHRSQDWNSCAGPGTGSLTRMRGGAGLAGGCGLLGSPLPQDRWSLRTVR
jgi:hypothetical protein